MDTPSPDRSARYDAIVVGARCAGSPTAMHLARKGYKVLLQQVTGAVAGNQPAMDGFIKTFAGVTSPAEFFDPQNVGRIFAGAHQPAAL